MFQPRSIQSSMTFRDKIMSMDYILLSSILLLGTISMFAMYSTDGGQFNYHTKSHILRFGIFFLMFLRFRIRFDSCEGFLVFLIIFLLIVFFHLFLLLLLLNFSFSSFSSALSWSSFLLLLFRFAFF